MSSHGTRYLRSMQLTVPSILISTSLFWTLGVQGQGITVVHLAPTQDGTVGVHPGYQTANSNYDWSTHFSAFSQPGNMGGANYARSLVAFDLSSIPADATVVAAFLDLTGAGPVGPGDVSTIGHVGENAATLRRIVEPWDATTVTWNTRPDATEDNMVALPASTYATQNYLNIDVTALVQDMVQDPANSHGFQLQLDDESVSRGLIFFSSEVPEMDHWPALTVIHGECLLPTQLAPQHHGRTFTLVPNATQRGGHMVLTGGNSGMHVVITDPAGRSIQRITPDQWPVTVQTNGLSAGAYVLQVMDDGRATYTQRFVVN